MARKATGSYYTPRAVVEYMVDEALIATLSQQVSEGSIPDESVQDGLRTLLDYDESFADRGTVFSPSVSESIVRAIADLKVLDPAVGSGAFPMGILHKLTLALRRLDPHNENWEVVQKELAGQRAAAAFETADSRAERDSELAEISDTFEHYRDSDFGRKLYLIQNSIYGVDIQPTAIQIAKLRFFISLAIEQRPNAISEDNYGIRPLPNLETRFVAADTLLSLEKPSQEKRSQLGLGETDAVQELERKIAANRERHYHANTRSEKLRCRDQDAQLRKQMSTGLQSLDMPATSAKQVAEWDPFDQNADAAGWFDAEYMFGVIDGFDVVIGNPPYVQLQKDRGRLGNKYRKAGFSTLIRTGDIYQLFYEKGISLLTPGGLLSYITSNSWLKAEYGKSTRRMMSEDITVLRLLEAGKDVFEEAIVDSNLDRA